MNDALRDFLLVALCVFIGWAFHEIHDKAQCSCAVSSHV